MIKIINNLCFEIYGNLMFFLVDISIVLILRLINDKNSKPKKFPLSPKKDDYIMQERELNGFKKPLSKVDEWLTGKNNFFKMFRNFSWIISEI